MQSFQTACHQRCTSGAHLRQELLTQLFPPPTACAASAEFAKTLVGGDAAVIIVLQCTSMAAAPPTGDTAWAAEMRRFRACSGPPRGFKMDTADNFWDFLGRMVIASGVLDDMTWHCSGERPRRPFSGGTRSPRCSARPAAAATAARQSTARLLRTLWRTAALIQRRSGSRAAEM